MTWCDRSHHATAEKLFRNLPTSLTIYPASREEDINSVADAYMITTREHHFPFGMKKRGKNAKRDYNLTAWSAAKGDLKEFHNAGDKLYLYEMGDAHRLIMFPEQSVLDKYLPPEWPTLGPNEEYRMVGAHACVRSRSPFGSRVSQGVIFVQKHKVIPLVEWDKHTLEPIDITDEAKLLLGI